MIKTIPLKYVLATCLTISLFWGSGLCSEDLLRRVPELQKTARLSNGGALGCGIGTLTLITNQGKISVQSGLDPIHVFGNTIVVSDIHELLKSRADSNHTGNKGPMSGEVSDLCYVTLYTLSLAKDPVSIPVIADLLTDKDDTICGSAAIALYRIGNSTDELQKQVQKIIFPEKAVESANAKDEKPPSWVIIGD